MKWLVTSVFVVFVVVKSSAATEDVRAASAQHIEWLDQEGSKECNFDDTANDSPAENLPEALRVVEWVRSEGGYFSHKIKIQPLDKDDPNSPNGVFALEPIKKNETLVVVPVGCFLTAGNNTLSNDMCNTARNLVRQYRLQDKSPFWPYVSFLFGGDKRLSQNLPSAWSETGKNLLKHIIGRELEPQDVAGVTFKRACSGARFTPEEKVLYNHAWRLVVARGWADVMLPVVDMFNHRNGHWRNVVQATSAHTGEDLVVVALRDIEAGEQLYITYNECHDLDCEGIGQTYVTPQLLRDYGFVEQYPRRFNFKTQKGELRFELDESAEGELQLTWLHDRPNTYQLNWLRAHFKRLQNLHDFVSEQVEKLPSSQEKESIVEYYEALSTALNQAILNAMGTEEDDAEMCGAFSHREYDTLEDKPDTLEYHVDLCSSFPKQKTYSIDKIQSQYQSIEFVRSYDGLDTCLWLDTWVHSCSSNRPHYHEVFVHYPARFVDEVKRVLFIGGGDNMVVHEILKYPSLELAVGLELDQQVVRSSFKNMGTQPHFDNKKVQWWFGDAAKSLQILPKDYFGTFDLVVIDLLSYVTDSLMVTKELSIMDATLLLVSPDGVIVQNDDFVAKTNAGFAKYTVDIENHDVPEFCQQSFTMGSNTVDFFNKAPKDHKIETLYLDSGGGHFDGWWNYRKNVDRDAKHCDDTAKKESTTEVKNKLCVLMILETEDTDVPLDSSASVRASVSRALQKAGLTEISVKFSKEKDNYIFYTMVFILQEGYVVVRAWPKHKYCGFDILLWRSFERQETAKTELIAAVGSNLGRSSSYRIVTSGMYGIDNQETEVGPNATGLCENSSIDNHVHRAAPFESTAMDEVLREMISLIQVTDPVIAVFCAEQSSPCRSLEALTIDSELKKVIPVWACPSVANNGADGMSTCESESLANLTDSSAKFGKISGIVIDPDAPRAMGRIMHKMLNNTRVRTDLLQREYVVVAAAAITQDETEALWRRALLERFRTEFALFSPAYRAEVLFNSSLELGVFSTGDFGFYSHLQNATKSVNKKTGLTAEVRSVVDGIINYIADIEPSVVFSDADFDHSAAYEQWLSQQPLGHQTIFQFEIQAPKSPVVPGERVLISREQEMFWTGKWYSGRVVEEKDEGTYDVIYADGRKANVQRDLIRKMETGMKASPIDVGERVLVRDGDLWFRASVKEKSFDGMTYKVHIYDLTGKVASEVERRDLIALLEPTDTELPEFSLGILKKALHDTFVESVFDIGVDDMMVYDDLADGSVFVVFWPAGNAIASWDGRTHIDVNLFTFTDNVTLRDDFATCLQKNIRHLSMMTRDEQPRGFGRVVNFQRELGESVDDGDPHWTHYLG